MLQFCSHIQVSYYILNVHSSFILIALLGKYSNELFRRELSLSSSILVLLQIVLNLYLYKVRYFETAPYMLLKELNKSPLIFRWSYNLIQFLLGTEPLKFLSKFKFNLTSNRRIQHHFLPKHFSALLSEYWLLLPLPLTSHNHHLLNRNPIKIFTNRSISYRNSLITKS